MVLVSSELKQEVEVGVGVEEALARKQGRLRLSPSASPSY